MVGSTAPSVTNAVLITPTIASLVNANHNHQNAAGGGTLTFAALPTRTFTAGPGLSGGGDLSADRTFTLDGTTFVNNFTLWDATQASRTWTANLSGATDPVWTFSNNSADLTTGVLKYGGNTVATSANDLGFFSATSSLTLRGLITDETGSGVGALVVFNKSPSIDTPTFNGAISFQDGVRQTFNPDATTPGLNVGAQAGDPSTLINGDIWYDSTGNALRARINGATVSLGAGGGGGSPGGVDTQVQFNDGGAFGGDAGMTYNKTTDNLTVGTVNKVTVTAPATAATLTIANNKTFAVNKTITLDGTDSTTITLPAATASVFSTASGEYNALTAKAKPTANDLMPIEDAAASNAKKKITIGTLPVMQRLSTRHWRMAQPIHGGDLSAMGMAISIIGTSSTILPTSTEPVMINYASAATTGSSAGMHNNGNHLTRTGRNIYFAAKVKLQETAATRVWIGLFFSSQGTVLAADTLGDFMGFRYSTVTADTNWKACNGLVSQTTTDSGVAADTNIHLFEIVCDDSVPNIKFYIDGTLVATNTTNLPSADNLQVVIGETTQANVAKNIRVGWIYVEDDL
jgi:hypothetical protein